MASSGTWLEVLAWVKTLFEATKATIDLRQIYEHYRRDRDTIRESERVSVHFSSFSEDEVRALVDRLQGCRDRFIAQGGGAERAKCICSVLNEAKIGNGGDLPLIDDWENIYQKLNCSSVSA
jgi:hypothetical protein